MKLLALDTATEACSCALEVDGEIYARREIAPRRHAELILPMLDEVLAEAGLRKSQLDGIAFGRGPGSFTGLRIACGVVQGIAFALDLPVVPVSCLAAMAQSSPHQQVMTAIDARMSEVYWGCYQRDAGGLMQLLGEEGVHAPETVPLPPAGNWHGVGTGWSSYHDALIARCGDISYTAECYPDAKYILPLAHAMFAQGLAVNAEQALPVYLRNQVVNTSRKKT